MTTPLWESYDETGHYSYARYIARNHALPPLGSTLARYNESHQPPLYYALVALPIILVDTSDDAQPRFAVGGAVYVVPDERIDAFPYRGTALALRLGRMVSVALSTLCVAITYLTVRTALPRRENVALLAAAVYAFWPLTLFLGGTITNDIGMALFGSLTLLFVVRLWVSPAVGMSPWRNRLDSAALACCLAGAVMTKDSAVSLLLYGGAVMALVIARLGRARRWRTGLEVALCFVIPLVILVAAGGILSAGRSLRQFSTTAGYSTYLVTGSGQVAASAAGLPPPSLHERINFFVTNFFGFLWRMTFETTFGTFGWGLLRMPDAWYDLAIAGVGMSCAGVVWFTLRRKRTRWLPLLLVLMIVSVALAPSVRTLTSGNLSLLNGRFLLPSLGAVTILMAVGLRSISRVPSRLATTYVLAGVALVAIMSPSVVILPNYTKPTLLDPKSPPVGMRMAEPITYGGSIQLLGYTVPTSKVTRGNIATIRLYWRALKPMAKDYALRVENFSLDGHSFQNGLDYTPGRSVYPTSFWQPGDTFAEDYYLPVGLDAPAPTLATFKVTWFDTEQDNVLAQSLAPVCKEGKVCEPKIGQIAVALDGAAVAQWANMPALFHLSNGIDLLNDQVPPSVRPGQTLSLTLVWRANSAALPELTTFVHLQSADGTLVAQGDSPPRSGLYPTSIWGAGEVIPDEYAIHIGPATPPGIYRLVIGMYDPQTIQRVPVSDAKGTIVRDYAIPLGEIEVQ
ncbi:MAG: glycosyltransferase family 39 protein [Chloroflexi bacterium]|nr:glycosyltransferase family 39 protein [Chloroflexota bacterium]MCL5273626.1 glycosyltransferase family 39 protein [Chloroflexota bacterium]